MAFVREFWNFLKVRKKIWLLPILTLMAILGFLVIAGSHSSVAPFLYTLF